MNRKALLGIAILALLNVVLNSSKVCAQKFSWAKRAGLWAMDLGYGVCADSAGNVFVAGKYEMQSEFDSITVPIEGNHDIFTAKYNSNGDVQWVRTGGGIWGDYAQAIAIDPSGNVYVTGEFEMTSYFHNGDSIATWGGNDMFLVKYDTHGNIVWLERAGAFHSDKGFDIAVNGSSIYIAGKFKDTCTIGNTTLISSGNDDILLAKYDTSGNVLWGIRAGGKGEDECFGVSVGPSGNVYFAGYFEKKAEFNGISIESNGMRDAFLAKYSPEGELLWVKNAGSTLDDYGWDVAVSEQEQAFITGSFRGNASFGNLEVSSAGLLDNFTACYNADGEALWVKASGGEKNDESLGIALDKFSNVYITGYYAFTADFDSVFITGIDSAEIFIASYTPEGKVRWVLSVESEKEEEYRDGYKERGNDIFVDSENNVLVTGAFHGDAIFGDIYLQGWLNTDIFVAKIEQSDLFPKTFVTTNESETDFLNVFPNPTDGNFNIVYGSSETGNTTIRISNADGKEVFSYTFFFKGYLEKSIDLGDKAPGIYYIEVITGDRILVKQIVLE